MASPRSTPDGVSWRCTAIVMRFSALFRPLQRSPACICPPPPAGRFMCGGIWAALTLCRPAASCQSKPLAFQSRWDIEFRGMTSATSDAGGGKQQVQVLSVLHSLQYTTPPPRHERPPVGAQRNVRRFCLADSDAPVAGSPYSSAMGLESRQWSLPCTVHANPRPPRTTEALCIAKEAGCLSSPANLSQDTARVMRSANQDSYGMP